MLANETSLKRGALVALMAALLQAVIAIALVGAARFVFTATASEMNHAADLDRPRELLQHRRRWRVAGLAQGRSTDRGVRRHADRRRAVAAAPAYAGVAWGRPAFSLSAAAYRAGPPGAAEEAGRGDECVWSCPCFRPCSARRIIFLARRGWNGDRSGRAAQLGRASGAGVRHDPRGDCSRLESRPPSPWRLAWQVTTGALAWTTVFAKSAAMRLAAGENSRLCAGGRGSNSPPRSQYWRWASRFWSGRRPGAWPTSCCTGVDRSGRASEPRRPIGIYPHRPRGRRLT